MTKKYTPPLSNMVVKAEDCYDPRDYVMVHKDHLADLQQRAALTADAASLPPTLDPRTERLNELGRCLDRATVSIERYDCLDAASDSVREAQRVLAAVKLSFASPLDPPVDQGTTDPKRG